MRNIDVRDVQLAEALDRAVREFHPSPEERLQGIRRKGNLRRAFRWTAVCTALFLFLGATGWAALRLAGNQVETASPAPAPWRLYEQSDLGWSLRYPASWRTQEYNDLCGHGEDERTIGVLVSNVRHLFRHPEIPNGCTSAWDMRGLPSDLVVVEFGKVSSRGEDNDGGRSPLPLSLEAAKTMGNEGLARYGVPDTGYHVPVTVGNVPHALHAWMGEDASAADRGIAERIVASIRHLPDGAPFGVRSIDLHEEVAPGLPDGWFWTAGQGEHLVQLTISTNEVALEGLIRGCLPTSGGCRIRALEVSDLGASDAFISISVIYPPPCLGCSVPPPPSSRH